MEICNNKILPILFVIAALTEFGSTTPMMSKLFSCLKKECSDPCKSPTGKKITDLPYECLGIIFQFFAGQGNIEQLFALEEGIGCELFKKVINKTPCFLACGLKDSRGAPIFLFWRLKYYCMDGSNFYKMELNGEKIGKFLKGDHLTKLVQNPIKLYINKRESDEENFNQSLQNSTNTFDKLRKQNRIFFSGSNKELSELKLCDCSEFTGDETWFEGLENLHTLSVKKCHKFTGGNKGSKKKLECLTVIKCNQFDGDWIKDIQNLEELKVYHCEKFFLKGIKHLKKLKNLQLFLLTSYFRYQKEEFKFAEGCLFTPTFGHEPGELKRRCVNEWQWHKR